MVVVTASWIATPRDLISIITASAIKETDKKH